MMEVAEGPFCDAASGAGAYVLGSGQGVLMTDRGWHDDTDYQDAVSRAERMTRFSWRVIATVSCALLGVVVLCLVAWVAFAFAVTAMD